MAVYEFYCSNCDKRVETIRRMGDLSSPPCSCGENMTKLISLPQPAIMVVTNREMFANNLNNQSKAYEFPGNPEQQARYKSVIRKSLTREKETIGRGFSCEGV